MLTYKNILLGQNESIIPAFNWLFKEENIDTIIEIGTHRGGLALWLSDNTKDNVKIYSYDITHEYLLIKGNDRMELILGDCFDDNIKINIISKINNSKQVILLCDGGDKNREFNTYAPFIRKNDIIMLHDYCLDTKLFDTLIKNGLWTTPLESDYPSIKQSIINNNLVAIKEDLFNSCLWGCYKKK